MIGIILQQAALRMMSIRSICNGWMSRYLDPLEVGASRDGYRRIFDAISLLLCCNYLRFHVFSLTRNRSEGRPQVNIEPVLEHIASCRYTHRRGWGA